MTSLWDINVWGSPYFGQLFGCLYNEQTYRFHSKDLCIFQ